MLEAPCAVSRVAARRVCSWSLLVRAAAARSGRPPSPPTPARGAGAHPPTRPRRGRSADRRRARRRSRSRGEAAPAEDFSVNDPQRRRRPAGRRLLRLRPGRRSATRPAPCSRSTRLWLQNHRAAQVDDRGPLRRARHRRLQPRPRRAARARRARLPGEPGRGRRPPDARSPTARSGRSTPASNEAGLVAKNRRAHFVVTALSDGPCRREPRVVRAGSQEPLRSARGRSVVIGRRRVASACGALLVALRRVRPRPPTRTSSVCRSRSRRCRARSPTCSAWPKTACARSSA